MPIKKNPHATRRDSNPPAIQINCLSSDARISSIQTYFLFRQNSSLVTVNIKHYTESISHAFVTCASNRPCTKRIKRLNSVLYWKVTFHWKDFHIHQARQKLLNSGRKKYDKWVPMGLQILYKTFLSECTIFIYLLTLLYIVTLYHGWGIFVWFPVRVIMIIVLICIIQKRGPI